MIAEGKKIAEILEYKIVKELSRGLEKGVHFVLFGTDPVSVQFLRRKCAVGERIGVATHVLEYPEATTTQQAVEIIKNITKQKTDGIVIQLPLPSHMDTTEVLNSVPFVLDIDMLGIQAKTAFVDGVSRMIPPVARAIHEILSFYNITLSGKKIVIVGNGLLVGQPVSTFFRTQNIPFQIIDKDTSETEKLQLIYEADIVISGCGVAHYITPDMVKESSVLIDAGTSEQSGKIVGDIDPRCGEKVLLLTPIPGGVGPVTVVSLFANIL